MTYSVPIFIPEDIWFDPTNSDWAYDPDTNTYWVDVEVEQENVATVANSGRTGTTPISHDFGRVDASTDGDTGTFEACGGGDTVKSGDVTFDTATQNFNFTIVPVNPVSHVDGADVSVEFDLVVNDRRRQVLAPLATHPSDPAAWSTNIGGPETTLEVLESWVEFSVTQHYEVGGPAIFGSAPATTGGVFTLTAEGIGTITSPTAGGSSDATLASGTFVLPTEAQAFTLTAEMITFCRTMIWRKVYGGVLPSSVEMQQPRVEVTHTVTIRHLVRVRRPRFLMPALGPEFVLSGEASARRRPGRPPDIQPGPPEVTHRAKWVRDNRY